MCKCENVQMCKWSPLLTELLMHLIILTFAHSHIHTFARCAAHRARSFFAAIMAAFWLVFAVRIVYFTHAVELLPHAFTVFDLDALTLAPPLEATVKA